MLRYETVYGVFSKRLATMVTFDRVGENSQYTPVNF